MSVHSYLAQSVGVASVDVEGMPEFMPGHASDAGTTTGSNLSVGVPSQILSFVEDAVGRRAERAKYSQGGLFCPGSMTRISVPSGGARVLVDLNGGWDGKVFGVPVRSSTTSSTRPS